jgi:hypothetical protein
MCSRAALKPHEWYGVCGSRIPPWAGNELGSIGDGDLTGIIKVADRIEREIVEISDEIHQSVARAGAA